MFHDVLFNLRERAYSYLNQAGPEAEKIFRDIIRAGKGYNSIEYATLLGIIDYEFISPKRRH